MNPLKKTMSPALIHADGSVSEAAISQLVGQVYEIAPPAERSRLLEHLLKPLGVLSLVAIANGIFASIRFRSGWPDIHARVTAVQKIAKYRLLAGSVRYR